MSPCSRMVGSRLAKSARRTRAGRPRGAFARRRSRIGATRPPSPTTTRSSTFSVCRSSGCPISRAPIRRSSASRVSSCRATAIPTSLGPRSWSPTISPYPTPTTSRSRRCTPRRRAPCCRASGARASLVAAIASTLPAYSTRAPSTPPLMALFGGASTPRASSPSIPITAGAGTFSPRPTIPSGASTTSTARSRPIASIKSISKACTTGTICPRGSTTRRACCSPTSRSPTRRSIRSSITTTSSTGRSLAASSASTPTRWPFPTRTA